MIKSAFYLVVCWVLTGCSGLLVLQQDLKTYDAAAIEVTGTLRSPDCPDCLVVIVAMTDDKTPASYRLSARPGNYRILITPRIKRLFAFNDLNRNLEFDAGEPFATLAVPEMKEPRRGLSGMDLELKSRTLGEVGNTFPQGNLFRLRDRVSGGIPISLGSIASLKDQKFDRRMADLGMWRPTEFMLEGLTGIYFLEPYSAKKTPVLFVHGIDGSPGDFEKLARKIDRTRYQPWFLYYPSGLDIQTVAQGTLGMLEKLSLEYRFQRLHLVAHSMGGLVSRALLNICRDENACAYIASFTSISSPFGGVPAAASGVKYSPVVMPVWRSLEPEGAFITGLFAKPLPNGIPHYLFFGFRNGGGESGDGTIPLSSQLRYPAQTQAAALIGLPEDHLSILASDRLAEQLDGIFGRQVVAQH